jgi:triosephosphate isomerase
MPFSASSSSVNSLLRIFLNLCRLVLSLTLILSGFVKAIDPLGTQYKIQDYLTALGMGGVLPDWATLSASVVLSATEFCLGIFLLFAMHRRTVTKLTVALMAVMTVISLWLWIANPISDCGCFGDALVLTNGQTLAKNVVLLVCAVLLAIWPLSMVRLISRTNQWIVINYTLLFIIATSLWCLYDLPLFDFRPYHEGADIRAGMELPDSAAQPKFETKFILEKDGERRTFTLEDYPDSTWTFIDSETVQVSEGDLPPIHDFSITRIENGEDITDMVIDDPGYTFLLISPTLEDASDGDFGEIDQIYEYCEDNGYQFYCLTSSGESAIERWRDLTGAEYPFCSTDGTTLKTIIRSNPGLLLLHGGKVVRKWSHNFLPDAPKLTERLEDSEIGQPSTRTATGKIATILSWFVFPLLALTIADRLWAWTRRLMPKKARKTKKGGESGDHQEQEKE